eukprot:1161603-Pelagomonas_calceolata.AAC.13
MRCPGLDIEARALYGFCKGGVDALKLVLCMGCRLWGIPLTWHPSWGALGGMPRVENPKARDIFLVLARAGWLP